MVELSTKLGREEENRQAFKSVAIIGAAGQTGELFARTLAPHFPVEAVVRERRWRDEVNHPDVRFHANIWAMLATEPEVVILATPNPTDEVLKEIALHAQKPLTLILPQNGVDVVPVAKKVLAESGSQIRLIRASLFTNVSRDPEGNIVYNPIKKRIALSSVDDDPDNSLLKAENMFAQAGFDVKVVRDYRSMEWSKLVVNLLGSTSTVTGLSPLETLSDSRFFGIEHRALKDRFRILDKAGIRPADLWFIGSLRLLSRVPEWVGLNQGFIGRKFRGYVAGKFAAERNNQPSAAARQIADGVRKVEATYYHAPMSELGMEYDLESPADSASLDILKRNAANGFSLSSLSDDERRKLFLETYGLETKEVFVKGISILGIEPLKILLEGMYNFYLESLKVSGKENLGKVAETLKAGKNVLIVPDHRSHSDHPTVVKALRENLPPETRRYPIHIVAGMKFDQEELSGKFSRAYPHPVVWTVTERDTEDVQWKAKIINRRARRVINKLLKEPCIFVVYLEGGRNKSGDLALQPPAMNSSWWVLNRRFGLVVPTVITGTEKMLPPGEKWPHSADIAIEFCEPIDAAELRNERRGLPVERWDERIAGRVMRAIAAKLPHHQRGSY